MRGRQLQSVFPTALCSTICFSVTRVSLWDHVIGLKASHATLVPVEPIPGIVAHAPRETLRSSRDISDRVRIELLASRFACGVGCSNRIGGFLFEFSCVGDVVV